MPEAIIVSDLEIMNGVPCFRGTRVPFKNLIDYLEGGHSLGEFLSELPGVERSSYEYAYVPAQDPLAARALHGAEIAPAGLWARRSRIQFRGVPLLSHEVFLPSTGRL